MVIDNPCEKFDFLQRDSSSIGMDIILINGCNDPILQGSLVGFAHFDNPFLHELGKQDYKVSTSKYFSSRLRKSKQ